MAANSIKTLIIAEQNIKQFIHYMGNNFIFVQPNIGPPNFFMGMSQGPLDISQNTF